MISQLSAKVSGKIKKGRPNGRWLDSIRNELSGMKRKTGLNRGVSYKTSTPHKNVK